MKGVGGAWECPKPLLILTRIVLPNIMADVTNLVPMAMEAPVLPRGLLFRRPSNHSLRQIGNLPLPAGGFFPSVVTAELQPYPSETVPCVLRRAQLRQGSSESARSTVMHHVNAAKDHER